MPVPPRPRTLRIAAVPAGHPYVRNIVDREAAEGEGLSFIADPRPVGAPEGQWWPPVKLDPTWISTHAAEFDVMHVHFGTESFSLIELQTAVDALRDAGVPLVYTVHDLTNPQLVDQDAHQAQLELLVRAADDVVTLTDGAAAEVRRRWGREAQVIAHPRIAHGALANEVLVDPTLADAFLVDAELVDTDDSTGTIGTTAFVIGLHLRDLRPNIAALPTLTTLLEATDFLADRGIETRVIVDLNERVRDDALREKIRGVIAQSPRAELREHPRFPDAELEVSLSALDVSVLPYAHGTHSGWLELCFDLGVAVVAPAVGFYAQQHPDADDIATFEPGSADSMFAALEGILVSLDGEPVDRAAHRRRLRAQRSTLRREQQKGIHLAHLEVYRRALEHTLR